MIMEFDEVVEIFGVFKKLHTSNSVMSITNFDGSMDNFKLSLISHMSLSSWDGLLIQYDSLDGRKMYPYRLMNVRNIDVRFE